MKLLFYIPGLVDGGAERVMASIASHFSQRGHVVTLAVDFTPDHEGPPLDPGVEIVELSGGHGASILKLARLLASDRPKSDTDIGTGKTPEIAISAIASHNFKLVMAALLARFFRLGKRSRRSSFPALVLTYHGFEEYKTGWMSWLGYLCLPLISRLASRVVAVSNSLASDLRQRWKTSPKNLLHIYNPVDITSAPRLSEAADSKKMILSVGRLVTDKRFDLLIEAFARLNDPQARLIILGEGPAREKLEQRIAQLGVGARIELPGFKSDLAPYYQQASCFVLTSRRESFGLVLVEALAHGLPILSTDSGGPREVLDNGRYGKILDADISVEELASALENELENRGDPAPRLVRARQFDLRTGMGRYEELFSQILREKEA